MRGENDTPPIFDDIGEGIPEESSGGWVHSCGGLIEEQDGRVAHQSHCSAQLATVTTTITINNNYMTVT